MPAVNIKDDETTELIRQLAELTDDTLTGATRAAVAERLERLRRERGVDERIHRLEQISRSTAKQLSGTASDHDWLYDETTGLPA